MVTGYLDDPRKKVQGMGGAVDLESRIKTGVVLSMEHCPKANKPQILEKFSIPPPGKGAWTQSSWKRPCDVHKRKD